MGYFEVKAQITVGEGPDVDLGAFAISYRASATAAASITAQFANAYLSGVTMFTDAAGDVVFVVNDLAEGHFTAAAVGAAFVLVPLIGARVGEQIVFRASRAGEDLLRVPHAAREAVRRAASEASVAGKYAELAPHFNVEQRLKMVDAKVFGTVLSASDCRAVGKANKIAAGHPRPSASHILHHDLPCNAEMNRWFIAHGIDINADEFTRWVPKDLHDIWHAGPGGGEFNALWQHFIDLEAPGTGYTRSQVIARLEAARRIARVP